MAEPTDRTPPEVDRVAASRAAVEARRARAALKNSIAVGAVTALSVLDDGLEHPDGVAGRMRVTDFLLSVPAIGRTKLSRILEDLGISPSKRIGGLGHNQRVRLRNFVIDREARNRGRRKSRLVVLAGPTAVGKG
ncbi:MAG: integration host factor, actinobacterial type, partial [Mycetocola sp.]